MKELFIRIKNALGRLEDCIRRFPFSFVYLCLITLAGSYQILSENELFEVNGALAIGGLSCFLLELAYEYGILKHRPVSPVSSVAISVGIYLLLKTYDNAYVYTAAFGLGIAIVSLVCFILYRDRENRNLFSGLIKSAFIVQIFVCVILAGFSVCIAAFHFLIFNFHNIWKLYGVVFLAVSTLFGITLFLSYVPRPKEDIEVPSTYRTMIHKALFYIYLVLIGILYLYIIKIVVTWKMPVGKLNWFGSFALLFYVFFYLSVDETDGRIQEIFKRYGAYLLLPVLAIQLFAIVIRLNAYGLTTARYVSLILIGVAVCFMLSGIFRFPVSRCFVIIAAVALLFTCTPLNIFDVPNRVQEQRLKNALSKGGALINGVLDDSVKLEAEYLEDVKSAYDYLRWSDGNKSSFFTAFAESRIAKSFDNYGYDDRNIRSYHYSYELNGEEIDVSGYRSMQMMSEDGTDRLEDLGLSAFLLSLEQDDSKQFHPAPLAFELSDGRKLIFEYISYEYDLDEEEFIYLYYSGILLSR